jgi:hypothetical protein
MLTAGIHFYWEAQMPFRSTSRIFAALFGALVCVAVLAALFVAVPAYATSAPGGVDTTNTALPFSIQDHTYMTLTTTGLGIGTTAPIQELVVSNNGAEGIEFNPIREGADTLAMFTTNRSTGNGVDFYLGANSFHFQLPIGSNDSFTIGSTGNVGIGSSVPARTLDLGENGQMTFGNSGYASTSSPGIFWFNDNANYGIYKTAGAWSGNYQQLELNWTTGIVIDGGSAYGKSGTELQPNGGNVGVGMYPVAPLDVNGGIRGSNSSSIVAGVACSPEGMLAYDMTNHQPVYCSSSLVWSASFMPGFTSRTWRNLIGGTNSSWTNYGFQNTNSYPIEIEAWTVIGTPGQYLQLWITPDPLTTYPPTGGILIAQCQGEAVGDGCALTGDVPPGYYWMVHSSTGGVGEYISALE